ncbi:hypothetical protein MyNCGM121_05940 [Achromobacter xylosoxidans]
MVAAATTRLRALTWLVPLKITPFWFTTSTVPSAWIAPWIWLGRADAPTTRFSTASSACCWNRSVVLRPTLNVSQFRMARDCVCSMVTSWRPPSVPVRGLLAPSHLACAPSAIHSPPCASPSGTAAPLAAAAARAAACAACCAATAAAVRFRLSSERCNCWRDCACWRALLPMPARLPSGMRPVRCAVDCTAPLSANQAGLKARACACAAPLQPPATSSTANACVTGLRRQAGRRERRGELRETRA